MNGTLVWDEVRTTTIVTRNGEALTEATGNMEKRLVLKSEGRYFDADFGVAINARMMGPDLSEQGIFKHPIYIKRCGSIDGTNIIVSQHAAPVFQEECPPHIHGWHRTNLLILAAVNDTERSFLLEYKEHLQPCNSTLLSNFTATSTHPPTVPANNEIRQFQADDGVRRYLVATSCREADNVNSVREVDAILSKVLVAGAVDISTDLPIESAVNVLRHHTVQCFYNDACSNVPTMVSMLTIRFKDGTDVILDMLPYYTTIQGQLLLGNSNEIFRREVYRGRMLYTNPPFAGLFVPSDVDQQDKIVLKLVSCTGTSTVVKDLIKEAKVFQMIHHAPASVPKNAVLDAGLFPSFMDLYEFAAECQQNELLLATDSFSRTNCLILPFHKSMCIQRSVIQKRASYSHNLREKLARFVLHDVAQGIMHMHNQNIAHLDISTENILTNDQYRCVITDFGEARCADDIFGDGILVEDIKRKRSYVDPKWRKWMQEDDDDSELLVSDAPKHYYDDISELKQLDVWCLGILLFILLIRSGPSTFAAKHAPANIRQLHPFDYDHHWLFYWIDNKSTILNGILRNAQYTSFSFDSLSLLKALLQTDPAGRPTMAQVLKHDWFFGMDGSVEERRTAFTTYPTSASTDTTTALNSKKRTIAAIDK